MTDNETSRPEKIEATLEDLEQKVAEAQEALLEAASSGQWLDPAKLRSRVQNGSGGDVMMFALTDLVNQGKLDLGDDLRVRLHRDGE